MKKETLTTYISSIKTVNPNKLAERKKKDKDTFLGKSK